MSEAWTESASSPRYVLRLFVAGMTPRSQRAIANLRRICDERLAGRVDLATIDIFQQPHLAEEHQVVAAPTLLRLEPLPVKRLIGDLSDEARVLAGLDLPVSPRRGADER
ncbi:circadian clock KaiB family protein [Methylobacterium sp. J-068]|uniref:circadian clock KaiB family protein n=1 Tax=Methylobacterium sp. J-068 TaxID=2836649 RepID=UPI001FB925B2|nr:circadian clock KaiB family protein [Methylobacterium sp. J-068]MCJ2033382.1 circadian clock KaiB family protein [Methylobacterium sp. J-068]